MRYFQAFTGQRRIHTCPKTRANMRGKFLLLSEFCRFHGTTVDNIKFRLIISIMQEIFDFFFWFDEGTSTERRINELIDRLFVKSSTVDVYYWPVFGQTHKLMTGRRTNTFTCCWVNSLTIERSFVKNISSIDRSLIKHMIHYPVKKNQLSSHQSQSSN